MSVECHTFQMTAFTINTSVLWQPIQNKIFQSCPCGLSYLFFTIQSKGAPL